MFAAISGLRVHQVMLDVVGNDIANVSTEGFRREGTVFSEYIAAAGEAPSLSMGHGNTRVVDLQQAGLTQTGGTFDLAIQGDGFFVVNADGQSAKLDGGFTYEIPSPTISSVFPARGITDGKAK